MTSTPPLPALLKSITALVVSALLAGSALAQFGQRSLSLDSPASPAGQTPAGTVISAQARAEYDDSRGEHYSSSSAAVTVEILPVLAVNVTPDETAPSESVGQMDRIVRAFTISNGGNTPAHYLISSLALTAPAKLEGLYFDADRSGDISPGDLPVTIGATASPQVAAGGALTVLADFSFNGAASGSQIQAVLTARAAGDGSARGAAEDQGTMIFAVADGPKFSSPQDGSPNPYTGIVSDGAAAPSALTTASAATSPALPKSSPQAVVTPGQVITYLIAFKNTGGVTARSVVVRDEIPAGLDYVPGTLAYQGARLSDADDSDPGSVKGRLVELRLGNLPVGETAAITFSVKIVRDLPGAGLVNGALIQGANFNPAATTKALAVLNPQGIVFSARSAQAQPFPDATLALTTDPEGTTLVRLPPDGIGPNAQNSNPEVTGSAGGWAFRLSAPAKAERYYLTASAPSIERRRIEIAAEPAGDGLFNATLRAVDGRPVANLGGFKLVDGEVRLERLAVLTFNLPVFEARGLEISKAADKPQAEIGDAVTYRVDLRNNSTVGVSGTTVIDTLPPAFRYAAGTAFVVRGGQTVRLEPEEKGSTLVFNLGSVPANETASLYYRVRVGAGARLGENFNSAFAKALYPTGEGLSTVTARASVRVSSTAFSERQAVVGRVFEDADGDGRFSDKTDFPVAGARIYTQDGRAVTTDSAGLYSIPVMEGGAAVLSLDPTTVPQGDLLLDEGMRAGRSWTRLVRHPLGGGGLNRINFVLKPSPENLTRRREEKAKAEAAKLAKAGRKPAGETRPAAPETEEVPAPAQVAAMAERGGPRVEETPAAPKTVPESKLSGHAMAPVSTMPEVAIPPAAVELSIEEGKVILEPALSFEARVAAGWYAEVELNGVRVPDTQIGVHKTNPVVGYVSVTYYGLNLKPGANQLSVAARRLSDHAAGQTRVVTLFGRGQARTLKITPERQEIRSGGRDTIALRVQAFDELGHPAADDMVAVEATAGRLSTGEAGEVAAGKALTLMGGEAVVKLTSDQQVGEIRLRAASGKAEATATVRSVAELRPTLLVAIGEATYGPGNPDLAMRGDEGKFSGHLGFFYKGRIGGQNLLTLSYDSRRPLNRIGGADTLFERNPQDRLYPLFGDDSTRCSEALSNSKLYARFDRGRHYALFGDFTLSGAETRAFETGAQTASGRLQPQLFSYERKLTGAKTHLEAKDGSFVTVAGARPDTEFMREVFPGGSFGLLRLSSADILAGSETITVEVRDRRNPELLLKRETLARGIDYQIDYLSGQVFFQRLVSAFDSGLNLIQVVVTYERRGAGSSSNIYLAQGAKNFQSLGLEVGAGFVHQGQQARGDYRLGGVLLTKRLPRGGVVTAEWAFSSGPTAAPVFSSPGTTAPALDGGRAWRIDFTQALPWHRAVIKASFRRASEGFSNPYGSSVVAGAQRTAVSYEFKPRNTSEVKLAFTDERNQTSQVSNDRQTVSASWSEQIGEKAKASVAVDHREFHDEKAGKEVSSNLLAAGLQVKPTDKLEVEVKREQNLTEADPTYPTQTTFAASYQASGVTKLFVTSRLGSAPISPISDTTGSGFAASASRRETAFGVETKLGRYTSLTSRYQLENGAGALDSYAILGLSHSLPLSKRLALDLGFERGFHVAGPNWSFTSASVGATWAPGENFKGSFRYEVRDRLGLAHILTAGAAGRLNDSVTALGRLQAARGSSGGSRASSWNALAAVAVRPRKSDRGGLPFSYNLNAYDRNLKAPDGKADPASFTLSRESAHTFSADGFFQVLKNLELYGRAAYRRSSSGGAAGMPTVTTGTLLFQSRLQYRFSRSFDAAVEGRWMDQRASATRRTSSGAEIGYWPLPDLRLGVGYNFTGGVNQLAVPGAPVRRGFYCSITTKLSRLFNLFGTSKEGLAQGTWGDRQKEEEEEEE